MCVCVCVAVSVARFVQTKTRCQHSCHRCGRVGERKPLSALLHSEFCIQQDFSLKFTNFNSFSQLSSK